MGNNLKWIATTESLPTEPGYYWIRVEHPEPDMMDDMVALVHVIQSDEKIGLVYELMGKDHIFPIVFLRTSTGDAVCHWVKAEPPMSHSVVNPELGPKGVLSYEEDCGTCYRFAVGTCTRTCVMGRNPIASDRGCEDWSDSAKKDVT